jgi:WS/DGAT/MGAT family acyltransferase
MVPGERMSAIDLAWLRMDRATNPMTIVTLIVLERPCPLERLKALLGARLLAHPRFRCTPVDDALGARWAADPGFDLDAHVGVVRLTGRGRPADLERLVGRLASMPLPADRPRWRADLVPGYGPGCAVVLRIHHCYADGIALVKVFLGLTSDDPAAEPPAAATPPTTPADDSADWQRLLPAPAAALVGGLVHGARDLLDLGAAGWRAPGATLGELGETVAGLGTALSGTVSELAGLLALPDDPATPLRGALGGRRAVAVAPSLPLADVRTVAHALGCTVNDVLLSTVAGGLGRYLRRRGVATDGMRLRAAVPVNLRPADAPEPLGNRFGLVLAELPVGLEHPLERLYAVRSAMQALKGSRQPVATFAVLSALGWLPAPVEGAAIDLLSRKASAVISNVPGPRTRLYLCGCPIGELYFWVPQSGSIGVGISLLTYADRVLCGMIADAGLVPRPGAALAGLGPEFERLSLLTLLGAAGVRAPRTRRTAPRH